MSKRGGYSGGSSSTPEWKSSPGTQGLAKRLHNYNESRVNTGLYQTLSASMLDSAPAGDEGGTETDAKRGQQGPQNIQEFVTAIAVASGARPGTFMPFFFLNKQKWKRKPKSCRLNVPFSAAERRHLGLHLLPRKGLRFEDFVTLHSMWKEYMVDLLNIRNLQEQELQDVPQDTQESDASLQLLKADYHGALVSVTRSLCPSHVGITGIVIMDTKNTVKLIGQDDTVRTVPKDSSVFSLNVDGFAFTVFGKYLCIRPAERSVKKIKARMAADL